MYFRNVCAFIAMVYLQGCAWAPGSHIDVSAQPAVKAVRAQMTEHVEVQPITSHLIAEHKQAQQSHFARENTQLISDISGYEYQIGLGDVLSITIWDHPELTIPAGSFRSSQEAGNSVHADGSIFYPYIGKVQVAGKTVTQVRDILSHKLSHFIESPQVDVRVAAFRSQRAYLTGEVNQPGPVAISNIPMTLLDAVNLSGGISANADWRNVTLTRDGNAQSLSLYGLMQRGDLTQNRLLKDGDIVHVPRNDNLKVFVMGDVEKPQLLKMDRTGMSLTEALSSVGGINELSADATGVFVIRPTHNPKQLASLYQLNVRDATAWVLGTEFDLRPRDVVYVTSAPISRWNRLISQLLPTISGFNNLTESVDRTRSW